MYIDNDDFSVWMQKLYVKLEELCKDVRVLRNADRVLPEDDNLLDNQDLCLLFKVSIKTLQRYRAIGALPYTSQSAEKCTTRLPMSGSSSRNGSALPRYASSRKNTARRKRSELESGAVLFRLRFGFMACLICRLPPLAARLARLTALPVPTLPPASSAVFKAFHRIGQASDESVVPFPRLNFRFRQIKAAAVCLSFHQDIAVFYIVVL